MKHEGGISTLTADNRYLTPSRRRRNSSEEGISGEGMSLHWLSILEDAAIAARSCQSLYDGRHEESFAFSRSSSARSTLARLFCVGKKRKSKSKGRKSPLRDIPVGSGNPSAAALLARSKRRGRSPGSRSMDDDRYDTWPRQGPADDLRNDKKQLLQKIDTVNRNFKGSLSGWGDSGVMDQSSEAGTSFGDDELLTSSIVDSSRAKQDLKGFYQEQHKEKRIGRPDESRSNHKQHFSVDAVVESKPPKKFNAKKQKIGGSSEVNLDYSDDVRRRKRKAGLSESPTTSEEANQGSATSSQASLNGTKAESGKGQGKKATKRRDVDSTLSSHRDSPKHRDTEPLTGEFESHCVSKPFDKPGPMIICNDLKKTSTANLQDPSGSHVRRSKDSGEYYLSVDDDKWLPKKKPQQRNSRRSNHSDESSLEVSSNLTADSNASVFSALSGANEHHKTPALDTKDASRMSDIVFIDSGSTIKNGEINTIVEESLTVHSDSPALLSAADGKKDKKDNKRAASPNSRASKRFDRPAVQQEMSFTNKNEQSPLSYSFSEEIGNLKKLESENLGCLEYHGPGITVALPVPEKDPPDMKAVEDDDCFVSAARPKNSGSMKKQKFSSTLPNFLRNYKTEPTSKSLSRTFRWHTPAIYKSRKIAGSGVTFENLTYNYGKPPKCAIKRCLLTIVWSFAKTEIKEDTVSVVRVARLKLDYDLDQEMNDRSKPVVHERKEGEMEIKWLEEMDEDSTENRRGSELGSEDRCSSSFSDTGMIMETVKQMCDSFEKTDSLEQPEYPNQGSGSPAPTTSAVREMISPHSSKDVIRLQGMDDMLTISHDIKDDKVTYLTDPQWAGPKTSGRKGHSSKIPVDSQAYPHTLLNKDSEITRGEDNFESEISGQKLDENKSQESRGYENARDSMKEGSDLKGTSVMRESGHPEEKPRRTSASKDSDRDKSNVKGEKNSLNGSQSGVRNRSESTDSLKQLKDVDFDDRPFATSSPKNDFFDDYDLLPHRRVLRLNSGDRPVTDHRQPYPSDHFYPGAKTKQFQATDVSYAKDGKAPTIPHSPQDGLSPMATTDTEDEHYFSPLDQSFYLGSREGISSPKFVDSTSAEQEWFSCEQDDSDRQLREYSPLSIHGSDVVDVEYKMKSHRDNETQPTNRTTPAGSRSGGTTPSGLTTPSRSLFGNVDNSPSDSDTETLVKDPSEDEGGRMSRGREGIDEEHFRAVDDIESRKKDILEGIHPEKFDGGKEGDWLGHSLDNAKVSRESLSEGRSVGVDPPFPTDAGATEFDQGSICSKISERFGQIDGEFEGVGGCDGDVMATLSRQSVASARAQTEPSGSDNSPEFSSFDENKDSQNLRGKRRRDGSGLDGLEDGEPAADVERCTAETLSIHGDDDGDGDDADAGMSKEREGLFIVSGKKTTSSRHGSRSATPSYWTREVEDRDSAAGEGEDFSRDELDDDDDDGRTEAGAAAGVRKRGMNIRKQNSVEGFDDNDYDDEFSELEVKKNRMMTPETDAGAKDPMKPLVPLSAGDVVTVSHQNKEDDEDEEEGIVGNDLLMTGARTTAPLDSKDIKNIDDSNIADDVDFDDSDNDDDDSSDFDYDYDDDDKDKDGKGVEGRVKRIPSHDEYGVEYDIENDIEKYFAEYGRVSDETSPLSGGQSRTSATGDQDKNGVVEYAEQNDGRCPVAEQQDTDDGRILRADEDNKNSDDNQMFGGFKKIFFDFFNVEKTSPSDKENETRQMVDEFKRDDNRSGSDSENRSVGNDLESEYAEDSTKVPLRPSKPGSSPNVRQSPSEMMIDSEEDKQNEEKSEDKSASQDAQEYEFAKATIYDFHMGGQTPEDDGGQNIRVVKTSHKDNNVVVEVFARNDLIYSEIERRDEQRKSDSDENEADVDGQMRKCPMQQSGTGRASRSSAANSSERPGQSRSVFLSPASRRSTGGRSRSPSGSPNRRNPSADKRRARNRLLAQAEVSPSMDTMEENFGFLPNRVTVQITPSMSDQITATLNTVENFYKMIGQEISAESLSRAQLEAIQSLSGITAPAGSENTLTGAQSSFLVNHSQMRDQLERIFKSSGYPSLRSDGSSVDREERGQEDRQYTFEGKWVPVYDNTDNDGQVLKLPGMATAEWMTLTDSKGRYSTPGGGRIFARKMRDKNAQGQNSDESGNENVGVEETFLDQFGPETEQLSLTSVRESRMRLLYFLDKTEEASAAATKLVSNVISSPDTEGSMDGLNEDDSEPGLTDQIMLIFSSSGLAAGAFGGMGGDPIPETWDESMPRIHERHPTEDTTDISGVIENSNGGSGTQEMWTAVDTTELTEEDRRKEFVGRRWYSDDVQLVRLTPSRDELKRRHKSIEDGISTFDSRINNLNDRINRLKTPLETRDDSQTTYTFHSFRTETEISSSSRYFSATSGERANSSYFSTTSSQFARQQDTFTQEGTSVERLHPGQVRPHRSPSTERKGTSSYAKGGFPGTSSTSESAVICFNTSVDRSSDGFPSTFDPTITAHEYAEMISVFKFCSTQFKMAFDSRRPVKWTDVRPPVMIPPPRWVWGGPFADRSLPATSLRSSVVHLSEQREYSPLAVAIVSDNFYVVATSNMLYSQPGTIAVTVSRRRKSRRKKKAGAAVEDDSNEVNLEAENDEGKE